MRRTRSWLGREMAMNLSFKRLLQAGLAIPVTLAITAASCGDSSSKGSHQGGSTQSTCEKVLTLPSPTPGSTSAPTTDAEQLTCLKNLLETIGTLSEDNKAGQLTPEYLQQCVAALATWHAWTDKQGPLWFSDNDMPHKPQGNCEPQPASQPAPKKH